MNIEDLTIKIDAARASEIRHFCITQPTMNLRWKVNRIMGLEERKLEQALMCRVCGKTEWREVPEVKEEA